MNDITDNLLSITRLFADDTSLASSTSNIEDLQAIMNHDLKQISNWSKQWLFTFNQEKTEVLYFGNQQLPRLVFNNTILSTTDTHKHLGVTLGNDLKWHTHINNILT